MALMVLCIANPSRGRVSRIQCGRYRNPDSVDRWTLNNESLHLPRQWRQRCGRFRVVVAFGRANSEGGERQDRAIERYPPLDRQG